MYVHDYMYACHVELFLQHFPVVVVVVVEFIILIGKALQTLPSSGNFYSFFTDNSERGLPFRFFYISANDGPDLYIRKSYKLGFV